MGEASGGISGECECFVWKNVKGQSNTCSFLSPTTVLNPNLTTTSTTPYSYDSNCTFADITRSGSDETFTIKKACGVLAYTGSTPTKVIPANVGDSFTIDLSAVASGVTTFSTICFFA